MGSTTGPARWPRRSPSRGRRGCARRPEGVCNPPNHGGSHYGLEVRSGPQAQKDAGLAKGLSSTFSESLGQQDGQDGGATLRDPQDSDASWHAKFKEAANQFKALKDSRTWRSEVPSPATWTLRSERLSALRSSRHALRTTRRPRSKRMCLPPRGGGDPTRACVPG